jgi:KaiC/GvpD/RAD55 family RecA-like ATPase
VAPPRSPHPASTLPTPSPAPPTAAPPIAPTPGRPGGGTSLTPRDIDQAKEDALLQLKIGRSSHYYAVIVSGALLLDALLVLFFPPNIASGAPHDLHSLYFLLFPLLGGLYLSVFGLQVKWEDYQLWPWEPHFSLTVASVGVDLVLAYLYFADLFGLGPTGQWSLLPWFYALALVGVMLPLVALGLTWAEWSYRKVISVGAAIAPVPLALALYIPTLGGSSEVDALAISLSASAVLFQMSGSFLHLIASGTRAHEREVITSGQNRLFQVAGELRKREEALQFREATLLRREADADNAETSLRRKLEALEESRSHTSQLEADVEKRSAAVTKLQRELAVKSAETDAQARLLADKDDAMRLREQDLALRLPKLSDREKDLMEREGALAVRSAEVDTRVQELDEKDRELTGFEERLAQRDREIEQKTAQLLSREAEIARPLPAPAAAKPTRPSGAEEKARLARIASELDQRAAELDGKSAAAKTILAQAEQSRRESARMVETLRAREAEVALREREAEERHALSESRVSQYAAAVQAYEEKTQATETRAAELGHREEEAARRDQLLDQRAGKLDAQEALLRQQQAELEALEQRLEVQAKRLAALEDELKYRDQALAHRGPGDDAGLSLAFAAAAESGPTTGRGPPRHRGAPPTEGSELAEELEAPPSPPMPTGRLPDRAPTGTPRLDDLLMGGLPNRGHVILIGDAFVEKEVAVYAYLAEGLKLGEPAIVLTAARGPEELSQRIGLVAPQFHEYEQLGMVRWIDASVPEGAPAGRPSTETRTTTHGPQDLPGILSALVRALNAFSTAENRVVRVAYLGLSATLAHLDESQRFQFIQNIVGVLKPHNALALYTLESGTLPDTQIETILSRLDGAIYFKRDRDKSYLSVQGFGEVQTHEWVEYRATNRALVIGSFKLERIR